MSGLMDLIRMKLMNEKATGGNSGGCQQTMNSTSWREVLRKSASLSDDEKKKQQRAVEEFVAYECLADMVIYQHFDDKTCFAKKKYRQQVEEYYRMRGYTTELPVSDEVIRVCREIQFLLYEKKDAIKGTGLRVDTQLSELLQGKNENKDFKSDLRTAIIKNQGEVINKIVAQFKEEAGEMAFDNFDNGIEKHWKARDDIQKVIMSVITDYVKERGATAR